MITVVPGTPVEMDSAAHLASLTRELELVDATMGLERQLRAEFLGSPYVSFQHFLRNKLAEARRAAKPDFTRIRHLDCILSLQD